MDAFVHHKLTEWGLEEYVEKFRDEKIGEVSLKYLEQKDIEKLIPELGPRSIFQHHLKELRDSWASKGTRAKNSTVKQRKRKSNIQGEGTKGGCTPGKRQPESQGSEAEIKSKVKSIMERVAESINDQENMNLKNFLQTKIKGLETDKRELVGVFGRTGAGKSSLINAVIGVKDLLPSGEIRACTTVMIKVEANLDGKDEFRAEIEFIKKEEWENEFWPLLQHVTRDDMDINDDNIIKKVSAVYGDKWKEKLAGRPIESKHFREIPEFLRSENKILTSETAKGLSKQLVKYTRNDVTKGEDQDVNRSYWPLVKCVTIKVPNNDFLQHVTLVDLPGNGDRNKSRDEMWRGIVGNCSTVWIVTEITRAASESEAWEILEEVCTFIGNGGECRNIGFICTKSDLFSDNDSSDEDEMVPSKHDRIQRLKNEVRMEFNKSIRILTHFSEECFEEFVVSSTEYFKNGQSQSNEIPKLQEFLKTLNDCHSETLNYVHGALGILSLIKGARQREAAEVKEDLCENLKENLNVQLIKIEAAVKKAYDTFQRCLSGGVEKSQSSWERILEKEIKRGINHKTLKSIVEKGGIHKTGKGKQINLNMELASCLLDSIDKEFRKTFPNEGSTGPFNGVINAFSLGIKELIQTHTEVKLHLKFLETEEEKIKKELNNIIRDGKKIIYNSLTETIKDVMEECYERAAEFKGGRTVANMIDTIKMHIQNSEDMFEQAKEVMLMELTSLKEDILENLEKTMMESIELSLNTDDQSLPDVSEELEAVKKLYDELKGTPAE